MNARRRIGCGALALASWGADALADDVRYAVDYRAPPSCPSAAAFRTRVSERAPEFPLANDGERFTVEIRNDGAEGYSGRVTFASGLERQVGATNCGDVVDAAALIAVVTLGYRAAPAPVRDPPASTGTHSIAAESNSDWHRYVGVSGGAYGGRSPDLSPSVGIFVDIQRPTTPLRAAMRAELGRTSYRVAASDGHATFSFIGGKLASCPLGIGPASLCLGAESGLLRVTTDEVFLSGAGNSFWFAGTAAAKYDLLLQGAWLVALQAGVVVPVTRSRFRVERLGTDEDQTIHEPGVSGFFSLGVGYDL